MPAALAALVGAAFTVAACYATGALVLQGLTIALPRREKHPLAFVLGAACLHLAVFAVLALKIAYWPVLVGMLVVVIAAAAVTGALRNHVAEATLKSPPLALWIKILFGAVFAVFTVLYFFNAWAPEGSPDGAGYHLGLVARYLRAHGFEHITTNFYASLSAGVEMLFVPAFAIGQHSAAALVHYAFLIALVMAMLAYGRRIGKPLVGAAGALLMYVSPVVGVTGTSAYNDVATAAIVFSVFYWLEIWDEQRDARLLVPIGLLAGYSYAAKYTAAVMLVYALGFVAWRARKIRPLLIIVGCATIMIAPWLVKNWVYASNPIAPFGNRIFRNPYINPSFEIDLGNFVRRYEVKNMWALPLEVTVRGERTTGLIGPAFLAAPLMFLALRYRAGRRLLAPGLLILSTYFLNIGTRFLIPCLPFFSLAMAMALGNSTPLLALLVALHAYTSWPPVIKRYAPYAWRLQHVPYKEALRRIPPDKYLRGHEASYSRARIIEENVPEGERVLAMNGVADSYTTREVLVGFGSASNNALADTVNMGWIGEYQPSQMWRFEFSEKTARRVRVLQTAKGEWPSQWSVHEMRFFDDGVELPRRPEWRLRAFPNPWDVQLAFDSSPATRWRTGETPQPGMYIDVDFGQDEVINEVRIETSAEGQGVQLQIEAMDAAGRWVKVAEKPKIEDLKIHGSIRLAATHEMHARGVNYLFLQDTDFGADEFRKDPESWGVEMVAHGEAGTLYRVKPE